MKNITLVRIQDGLKLMFVIGCIVMVIRCRGYGRLKAMTMAMIQNKSGGIKLS